MPGKQLADIDPDEFGTFRKAFAESLRKHMANAGLTPQEFADALGMSRSGVYHLLRARNVPRVDELPDMAEALGWSRSDYQKLLPKI